MSAEETQQPSFTVTAGVLVTAPTADEAGRSTRQPSPSSISSVANRYETDPAFRNGVTGASEEEEGIQTESLRQWTASQRRANELSPDHAAEPTEGIANAVLPPEQEGTAEGTSVLEMQAQEHERMTPELEVPDPHIDEKDHGFENDNVSTPTESATPAQEAPTSPPQKRLVTTPKGNGAKAGLADRPVDPLQSTLQPVDEYSPFKPRKSAPPSSSKKRGKSGVKRHATAVEQDSFADDDIRPKLRPADLIARMMQQYNSDSLDVSHTEGGITNDGVPGWDESAMQAPATIVDDPVNHSAQILHGDLSRPEYTEFAVSSDPSQASQSVPLAEPDSPKSSAESPTRLYLNLSGHSVDQSPLKSKRFGRMNETQSSQGMPGEAPFSQYPDLESQHSAHSIAPVATQSVPRRQVPLSSSPPLPELESHRVNGTQTIETYPRQSTTAGETLASSVLPRSTFSAKGTTQEATQLVTEDELMVPAAPPPTTTAPPIVRRVLPSARRWRNGNGIVSLPSRQPVIEEHVARDASTIAAPQAAQALAEPTMGPPEALVETYVDVDQAAATLMNGVREPVPPVSGPSSPPRPHRAGSPAPPQNHDELPLEPTFVDPTITSLPDPPPPRRTPKQYGKHAVTRTSPVSPIPQQLATPPPTAGPSRSPADLPTATSPDRDTATPPAKEAKATKSGRIPKRKRRDSSASMSGSSSSSEEIDPHDESYRPVSRTGSKAKRPTKASNLDVKRVKRGSRSASSSHRSPTSTRQPGLTSTPLTPPPTSSPPDRSNFVLAYWHPSWHIGRVTGMRGDRYEVDFEDDSQATVAQDKVRRGLLRAGDKICVVGTSNRDLEVSQEWHGESQTIKVKGGRTIALKDVYLRKAIINSDFDDRIVTPNDLGFDVETTPVPPPRPVMPPAQTSKHGSDTFTGKIFFITSVNSDHTKIRTHQKTVGEQIVSNGGKVVSNWEDLFDLPTHGFGSTLASTSAPFLLQETDQAALTPKVLVSLAKGIPCLSVTYLEDALRDPIVDWRSYLVESGFSEKFNQHCSQVVDGSWGKTGWNAATARAERRPFIGKTFLFLEPGGRFKYLRKLLLVCLHAMGASDVEVVTRLGLQSEAKGYDYVLVEDRDERKPPAAWLRHISNACNVAWLKQCLIIGAALQPGLYENK